MVELESSIEIHHGNYQDKLRNTVAHLIFTSPPYNIGSRSPRKDGFRKLGQYDPKSFGAIRDYPDSVPEQDYQDQQAEFLIWSADHITKDGVIIYNHKPRKRNKALIHPLQWALRPEVAERLVLVEEIIWDRGSTHNHDLTQLWAQTERLYVFRRADGEYRFRNRADLPYRSDVWRIPLGQSNGHACPFSIKLAKAVIETWSEPGELVCDPYLGSGTTALAAIELNRRFVGAEILEKYWRQADAAATASIAGWELVA